MLREEALLRRSLRELINADESQTPAGAGATQPAALRLNSEHRLPTVELSPFDFDVSYPMHSTFTAPSLPPPTVALPTTVSNHNPFVNTQSFNAHVPHIDSSEWSLSNPARSRTTVETAIVLIDRSRSLLLSEAYATPPTVSSINVSQRETQLEEEIRRLQSELHAMEQSNTKSSSESNNRESTITHPGSSRLNKFVARQTDNTLPTFRRWRSGGVACLLPTVFDKHGGVCFFRRREFSKAKQEPEGKSQRAGAVPPGDSPKRTLHHPHPSNAVRPPGHHCPQSDKKGTNPPNPICGRQESHRFCCGRAEFGDNYLIATIICEYKILQFGDSDDFAGINFCEFTKSS